MAPADVRHLLRRAAFGPDLDGWPSWRGLSYEDAVERLVAGLDEPAPPDPEGFDPYVPGRIQEAWLVRMRASPAPLAERLALFWHGHFATSDAKVRDGSLMWRQMRVFRAHGGGRFADLVRRVLREPATLRWLDGDANVERHPNENLGRELMELFTLGVGNYGEGDVREVARALTGHGTRGSRYRFDPALHDHGNKRVLGRTARFDLDDVVEHLCAQPACRRFVATRLLVHLADPEPPEAEIRRVEAALEASDGRIGAALRALFLSPWFRDPARRHRIVRSPVDFVVAASRACGAPVRAPLATSRLSKMGQTLFKPPSVKGWPAGTDWMTASGVVARIETARWIGEAADADGAPAVLDAAYGPTVPPALLRLLARTPRAGRVGRILASPSFQLA